jgi:hypothetical protein
MTDAAGRKKTNLSGLWHGLYTYQVASPPTHFTATIRMAGPSLSGSIKEAAVNEAGAPLDLSASLSGSLAGHAVSFAKTYDGMHGWMHTVHYDGDLNDDASEIEGVWTIPGEWSGRFLMIRAPGMTETIARQVYDRV